MSTKLNFLTKNAIISPIKVLKITWWGKCVAMKTLDMDTSESIIRDTLHTVTLIINLLQKCAWYGTFSLSDFSSHNTNKHNTADVTLAWPDGDPEEKQMNLGKKMSHIPCIKYRWQSRQTDTDGPLFIPFIPFPALFVVCANRFVMLCTFLLLLLLYTILRIQSLPPSLPTSPRVPPLSYFTVDCWWSNCKNITAPQQMGICI